jgi:hypothetical protein
MLDGFDDRSAYALCTFGYCEGPGHEPIIFEGRTNVSTIIQTSSITKYHYHRVKSSLHVDLVLLAGMLFFSLMDLTKRK